MSTVVLTRQAEISRARQRNQAVREALRQAEGATLAAVDQGTVIKSINDVMPLFNQQMNALQAKDYTTAAKIYPQMNLKLTIADELVTNPDMPNGAHKMLQYFRGVLATSTRLSLLRRCMTRAAYVTPWHRFKPTSRPRSSTTMLSSETGTRGTCAICSR